MQSLIHFLLLLSLAASALGAEPLRVFIRAGVKTHGPNQHDHPRFLADWTQLLSSRGIKTTGALEFPSPEQLAQTDVVVVYAADGMKIVGEQRAAFEKFLQRGGGLVVIHDAVVSADQHAWAKKVQGGAWIWNDPAQPNKKTKWHEGEVGVYFVDTTHPITQGISNFDWKDEIYYDLDMAPDAHVLATSFHSVFVIAPQLWTYEKTWEGGQSPYRAFVSLPGHEYDTFNTPHYRAILLRGIAWTGKRSNTDEFCSKEELASLKYPEGGPTAPEKAAAKLNLHPEFDIQLVASEPLVEKVISLDWDPRGRLWVAETPEYPNGRTIHRNDVPVYPTRPTPADLSRPQKENRPARDRVSWLEDSNRDGRMDKKHVFADGLELITSLVFHKDGVIVAQAPDILWLRDSNGDGKCDMQEGSEKITLYTGFGTGDSHAVINNFRWGLDGWIYSAIGYSAGRPIAPATGKDFGRVTAGIIRFKPDGSALEQFASGSCNTWGLDFAPDGEVFYTTATCGEHLLHIVMPEKILARGNVGNIRASWVVPDHQKIAPAITHTRPAYVQIDWVGAFTAAAGSCIYNGGAWPEHFDGSHFCSETTMELVHHEFIRPNGVSYISSKETGRENTEFIAATDLWFRPIHQRIGPDGALYILDFYNQAAIHNDTRGPAHGALNAATRPDRDHHFARIWRVQHKQARNIDRPNLRSNRPADLVKALSSPNGWVRDTASRLLRENGAPKQLPALAKLSANSNAAPHSRIAALYTLNALQKLDSQTLVAAINDPNPVVTKNALRIAYERDSSEDSIQLKAITAKLNHPDPRAQLNAIIALGSFKPSPDVARAIVDLWPSLTNRHTQSAALGAAAANPLLCIEATLASPDPAFRADLLPHLVRLLANKNDPAAAAQLVVLLAKAPPSTNPLKQFALESLAANLRADVVPPWNDELRNAFRSLVTANHSGLSGATLPLAARWDSASTLAADLKPVLQQLSAKLQAPGLSDDERAQTAANLAGVHKMDSSIIPSIARLLNPNSSPTVQKRALDALAQTGQTQAAREIIAAYSHLPVDLRDTAFDTLVRRTEWAAEIVSALSAKQLDPLLLGPANLHRLRTHSNKQIAAQANEVIDSLRGPEQKQKDQLVAQWKSEVEKPGNVANGKTLYTANCASCHVYKNEGRNLAPNLTGMGAHGPAELLTHIIDPNRVVEPNFISTTIETKDGLTYDGMIERENAVELVLRNAAADYTIRKDNIQGRTSSNRSLMPEGFEALGVQGLRDLLAYISEDDHRYRILDLRPAFTANTSRGIYSSQESREESLRFRAFGTVKVGDIPFEIVSPLKSPTGNNVVVLKGGSGFAKTLPKDVQVQAGFIASKLHILGGVGGWAYPYGGEDSKGKPAAKIVLHFAGGATEEVVLRNGIEIADYIGSGPRFEVPGSKLAPDLLRQGQLRTFSVDVKNRAVLQQIDLSSFDSMVAPTFVAITAEVSPAPVSAATPATQQLNSSHGTQVAAGTPKRVLLIGGGASHDYDRWFNKADIEILSRNFAPRYTEDLDTVLPALKETDVLLLSLNKPVKPPELRTAILDFAQSGNGVVLLHAATWINWPDWPEFNRQLVTGGSRSHDKLGEFEVTVIEPTHPLMHGVPPAFKIIDELYQFIPDDQGTQRRVLATGKSPITGKVFPVVWITEHPKARVACITLGHDGRAHDLPAFQQLLQNAVKWASEK